MTSKMGQVNIVVAHALEARPLIKRFGLKPNKAVGALTIYSNGTGVCVVITGMGKQSSHATTNRLAVLLTNDLGVQEGWLNVGIAGHKTAEVGSGFLANKIIDADSAKAVYPVPVLKDKPTSAVITVDQPELEYSEDAVYEMEAFGFWAAASNHSFIELVQVYKIISDNLKYPADQLDNVFIEKLIANHCDRIESVVLNLKELVREVNEIYRLPDEYEELQKKFRFTVTQLHQLKRLCRRFHALGLADKLVEIIDEAPYTSKKLIQNLDLALLSETKIE